MNAYKVSAGALSLLDGSPRLLDNPLTGQAEPWRVSRAYGCNYPIACENLLTFRSGAAGFYDLREHSGTGNFGGFKSGCTSNLVAADGVLNAPDYTRTCSCAYQNQTSLALVPMPDVEIWTHSRLASPSGQRVQRVGINLGAPGDRRAADGTLWLEWPAVGGDSPEVKVEAAGNSLQYFRRHSSQIASADEHALPWVAASGVENLQRLQITLADAADAKPVHYHVRLLFAEPEELPAGARQFRLEVNGRLVAEAFDPVAAAGGERQAIVVDVADVVVGKSLDIRLTPSDSSTRGPVLCGVSAVLAE